jgi:hypothetical protein
MKTITKEKKAEYQRQYRIDNREKLCKYRREYDEKFSPQPNKEIPFVLPCEKIPTENALYFAAIMP